MKKRMTDQQVQDLLSGITNFDNDYPPDLLEARRKSFLEKVAALTALGNAAFTGPNTGTATGSGHILAGLPGVSPYIAKVAGVALVTVIVVETIVITYLRRDRITDFIRLGISPTITVTSSPLPASPTAVSSATNTPQPTATPTQTSTLTPSTTPTPSATDNIAYEVSPTPSPKDRPSQHPVPTKEPTQTPDDTETPKPTDPSQTETPMVTDEPKYTETPRATEQTKITETPTGSNTE
jgi:hypothetical protein